jgi:AcrR family transcriptional regulator
MAPVLEGTTIEKRYCTAYENCVHCTMRLWYLSKTSLHRSKQRKARNASTWDPIIRQETENGLTLQRIIAAGIALADHEGLAAVSIRRIAAQLQSSPMALYHYIPSKRDLLNLMLDASNAEFEWSADEITDWREALTHFARESRRCLKQHPWVSALRAADPEYGPECIRMFESLLGTLSRFGLEVRTATRALGVLFVFVNGFVAAETGQRGVSKGQRRSASQPRFSRAILATGKFPNVARFVEMGSELPDDQGFERALNWILNGIKADLQAQRPVQTKQPKKSA